MLIIGKLNLIYYYSAIPGIIIAILIATTVSDPAKDERYEIVIGNIDDDDDDDDEVDDFFFFGGIFVSQMSVD